MKYLAIAWAGIFVEDLAASVAFYKDVLGLPFVGQGADYAHFRAGEGALLELLSGGKASPAPKDPEQQSTVISLRVEDLAAAMAELERKGVPFAGEIGVYKNSRWAHFVDPEGNQLEIKEISPAARRET